MVHFVDLMQDEVAGNMVTALFLNRQKAEKHLQKATLEKGVRFAVAGDGPIAQTVRAALIASKAILVEPKDATDSDIVVASLAARSQDRRELLLCESAEELIVEGVSVALFQSIPHALPSKSSTQARTSKQPARRLASPPAAADTLPPSWKALAPLDAVQHCFERQSAWPARGGVGGSHGYRGGRARDRGRRWGSGDRGCRECR